MNICTLTIQTWAPKFVNTGSANGLDPSLHGSKTVSLQAAKIALLPAFFNLVSFTCASITSGEPNITKKYSYVCLYYKLKLRLLFSSSFF